MSLRLTEENNSINLNNEMKKVFTLLLLLSGILFFTACDKDEPIENEYRMVVTCDTPDQEFIVQMAHRANFTTKNRFEFANRTTDNTFGGIIYCANPKAVITIQLYLNGKHYKTEYGTGEVHYIIRSPLKGKRTNPFTYKRPF